MSELNPELQNADIQDIKRMIPHRYPFLLIDAVKDIKLNTSAVAISFLIIRLIGDAIGGNKRNIFAAWQCFTIAIIHF